MFESLYRYNNTKINLFVPYDRNLQIFLSNVKVLQDGYPLD